VTPDRRAVSLIFILRGRRRPIDTSGETTVLLYPNSPGTGPIVAYPLPNVIKCLLPARMVFFALCNENNDLQHTHGSGVLQTREREKQWKTRSHYEGRLADTVTSCVKAGFSATGCAASPAKPVLRGREGRS
jgi:hypothetical protein